MPYGSPRELYECELCASLRGELGDQGSNRLLDLDDIAVGIGSPDDQVPAASGRLHERSEGAGIYVINYSGPNPVYDLFSRANADEARRPIYIGKAIPSGGRKGARLTASARGTALYKRLMEHMESIRAAEAGSGTLAVADFHARYLTVDDIWIPLGESLLISRFRPVWNIALDGFGNHDPGNGRYNGLRPLWDHLHPGRSWAEKCAARTETLQEVRQRIAEYLDAHPLRE